MYDTKQLWATETSNLKDLDQITITFRSDIWIIWVSSDGHLFDAILKESTS